MRLKRTRLGKDDFEPLVVIGRGAFGEVRALCENSGNFALLVRMTLFDLCNANITDQL